MPTSPTTPASADGTAEGPDLQSGGRPAETPTADLSLGIEPDHRYRCDACGNVTRFDVVMTATTRRFHHFDLGGISRIEEEEVLEQQIGSVTCRWCGRTDAIRVERAPVAPTGG